MSIRFPAVHIAESTANRIMMLHDEIAASRRPAMPARPPGVAPGAAAPGGAGVDAGRAPEAPAGPQALGSALNVQLAQPSAPMAAPTDPGLAGVAGLVAGGGNLVG